MTQPDWLDPVEVGGFMRIANAQLLSERKRKLAFIHRQLTAFLHDCSAISSPVCADFGRL